MEIGSGKRRQAEVVITVGVAGAGKSTYVGSAYATSEILCTDRFREWLSDTPADLEAHHDALAIMLMVLDQRCRRGLVSVIDSTGLDPSFRRRVKAIADRNRASTKVLCFDTPIDQCLSRNARRGPCSRVPERVVLHQSQLVKKAFVDILTESYGRIEYAKGAATLDNITKTSAFMSIPISENFDSTGVFRSERRLFYEAIFDVVRRLGVSIESAALNENWGSVKLPTVDFTRYDLDAIQRCDALIVVTNTRLSTDIYLEVGYAVALKKHVILLVPWGVRPTYMLQGMVEMNRLEIHFFDSETGAAGLAHRAVSNWLDSIQEVNE